jgi:radical SAM-linked protein
MLNRVRAAQSARADERNEPLNPELPKARPVRDHGLPGREEPARLVGNPATPPRAAESSVVFVPRPPAADWIGSLAYPQDMTTASKYRLRFAKSGDLRLTSHHDMMRCLERMFRRARLPLAMSQGFSPRPRIAFASPLALGIVGRDEALDIVLTEALDPADLLSRLREVSPAGLDWLLATSLAASSPAPRPVASEFSIGIPSERRDRARELLDALMSSTEHIVIRRRPDRGRETPMDLRPFVETAELTDDGVLRARLRMGPEGSARPEVFLEAVGLGDLLEQGAVLTRTRLELSGDGSECECP